LDKPIALAIVLRPHFCSAANPATLHNAMTETTLQLDGRLESTTVPAFERRLSEASLLGNERLLIDMSRVSFVGSAALRAILVAAKRLGASGGRLAIFAPPPIAQIFSVSGLDSVLPVHVSLSQAREALAG
jgi:anti-anti-sigma factor